MNFEDPFANDLSRAFSTVSGLGRSSPSSTLSAPGGLAGGRRGNPSAASPVVSSGMSADSSVGRGAAFPQSTPVSSGPTSLWGPSPTSAPVAGRRARVQPNATSASLGLPAGGASSSSAMQAAAPRSAEAAGASALSWLDEMDSSPPPVTSVTITPSSFSAPPPSQPAEKALPPSSSIPPFLVDHAGQEQLPSFLDFAATGTSSAGGSAQALRPKGVPAAAVGLPANKGGAAADAADMEERKKKEVRDLYATLDALDMEQERLEASIGDRQVKEETELLALETSILVKTTEVEDKEQELESKRAELVRYTADRLEALASRYAKEMDAQAAEVRSLDGARLEKQLQRVCDTRLATEQTLRELREQAALMLEVQPYSDAGVRLALFSTAPNVAVPPAGETDSSSSTAGATADAAGSPSAEPSSALESTLQRAVMLLRGYCDKRLRHTRDNLVDYVHTSALDAAHSVRRGREQAWMQDTVQHKETFSRYMVSMMQRYLTFYKERAALKQENTAALQADVRQMAAQLRNHAAERLQQLLRDVTTRIALSTQRHTQAADEARALLQKKASTVVEGDMVMAEAQHRELEGRLLAEANARRQRYHAEKESLTEQLHRLRRSGEMANENAFQGLRDAASATSSQHAQPLQEEALALKTRLVERLRGGVSGAAVACSAARMHAEELTHVIRSTIAQVVARQQAATLLRQQCDELRRDLTTSLSTEVVERLQQTRCVQHAHQVRIDALAKSWETAHRQNLAAACSLILPVSSSTPGTADAQYVSETYAAPQDVMSTALLNVLQDKLRARDDKRRSLLASRQQFTAGSLSRLEEIRDAQAALRDRCAELWSAAQTQAAQHRVNHELEVEVEKGLITVAAEQRVVDRDRRVVERRSRRTAELMSSLCHASPQHLLCSLLPSPLHEAVTAHLTCAPPLMTVDANSIPQMPSSNNIFTAVHTSNNATTMAKKSSPNVSSSSSSSPAPEVFQAKGVEEAPMTPKKMSCIPNAAEPSYATDTQPWSSPPLREEQQLTHDSTGESSDVPPAAQGSQQGGRQFDSAPTVHHDMPNKATTGVLTFSKGAQQADVTRAYCFSTDTTVKAEGNADVRDVDPDNPIWPSDTADEKRRGGSSSRAASLPLAPSTWAADSDATSLARTYVARESPTVLSAQQQPRQSLQLLHTLSEPTVSQPTWSTLEEYRSSSADVPNRTAAGTSATLNTATRSLDDWSDFLALLSCTDSPVSSFTS